MSLSERLAEYVRACFAGLWIQSSEHDDALVEIAQMCHEHGWLMATWDVDRGPNVACTLPSREQLTDIATSIVGSRAYHDHPQFPCRAGRARPLASRSWFRRHAQRRARRGSSVARRALATGQSPTIPA